MLHDHEKIIVQVLQMCDLAAVGVYVNSMGHVINADKNARRPVPVLINYHISGNGWIGMFDILQNDGGWNESPVLPLDMPPIMRHILYFILENIDTTGDGYDKDYDPGQEAQPQMNYICIPLPPVLLAFFRLKFSAHKSCRIRDYSSAVKTTIFI